MKEIIRQLRELIEKMKKPGGVPTAAAAIEAISVITNVLETFSGQIVDITALEQAITDLNTALTALREQTQALSGTVESVREGQENQTSLLQGLEERLVALEGRFDQLPREIQAKIGEALTQVLMDIENLKARDNAQDERLGNQEGALAQLQELVNQLAAGSIPTSELERIVNQLLQPILEGLQQNTLQDTQARARLAEVERQLQTLRETVEGLPTGLTAEQVQQKIDATTGPLAQNLSALQQQVNAEAGKLQDLSNTVQHLVLGLPESEVLQHIHNALQPLNTAIANQETQIGTALGQLSALQESLATLSESVSHLVGPDDLQNALQPIQNDLAGLSRQLGSETQAREQLESAFQTLQALVNTLPTSEAVEAGLQPLRTEDGRLQGLINALQEQINNLPGSGGISLEQLQQAISTALEPYSNKDNQLQRLINALQEQINSLPGSGGISLEQLQQAIGAALEPYSNKDNQLQGLINALQEQINNLPGSGGISLEQLQQAIGAALQPYSNKDNQLQGLITALQEQINNLPGSGGISFEQLQQAITAALEPYSNKDNQLQGLITGLQQLVSTLQTQIGDCIDLAQLQEQISSALSPLLDADTLMQEQIQALQTALTTLDGLVQSLPTQKDVQVAVQTALEEPISKINSLLESTAQDHQTLLDAVAEIEGLAERLNTLPDYTTETEVKAWLQSAVDTLNTTIIGVQQQITQTNAAVAQIQTDLTTGLAAVQEAIPTEQEIIQIAKAALQEAINGLNQLISQHQQASTEKFGTIDQQLGQHQTDLDALAAAQTTAQENFNEFKEEVTTAIGDLQQSGADTQEQVAGLEETVTGLEEKLEQAESTDPALRLARICLEGTGIVCGFDMRIDETNFSLKITSGSGVTPDGHLIRLTEGRHFTHYHDFTDLTGCPFFQKGVEADGQTPVYYDVWELSTQAEGSIPLTPQQKSELDNPFIQDKVVLLLREKKENEPLTIRYLLMLRDDVAAKLGLNAALQFLAGDNPDADFVYAEDFSLEDNSPTDDDLYRAMNPGYLLQEIALPRFGFWQGTDCDPAELDQTDFPEITDHEAIFNTYADILQHIFGVIEEQLSVMAEQYYSLLYPLHDLNTLQQEFEQLTDKWSAYYEYAKDLPAAADAYRVRYYIQYFYDWARDLINAYHELRTELLELMADCCAKTAPGRPILLLGLAGASEDNGLAVPLRDTFRQPPIYNGNAPRLETCRLYFRRMTTMISDFYLPGFAGDDPHYGPNCEPEEEPTQYNFDTLKITPSRALGAPLSEQSIPFYYPLHTGYGSLHRQWNYRRAKQRSSDKILSYHATDAEGRDSYSSLPEVVRPLYYTMDQYDFYRIEGHIGKDSVRLYPQIDETDNRTYNAYEALKYLVRKHNLDITILPLTVNQLQKESVQGLEIPPYVLVTLDTTHSETSNSFVSDILGAEHLGGVPKGGTYIMVMDTPVEKKAVSKGKKKAAKDAEMPFVRVIADFALPYRVSGVVAESLGAAFELETLKMKMESVENALQQYRDEWRNAFDTMQVQMAQMESSKAQLQVQIDHALIMEAKYQDIQAKLEDLNSSYASLQNKVEHIETANTEIIAQVRQMISAELKPLEVQIKLIQDQSNNYSNEIKAIQKQMTVLEQEIKNK